MNIFYGETVRLKYVRCQTHFLNTNIADETGLQRKGLYRYANRKKSLMGIG